MDKRASTLGKWASTLGKWASTLGKWASNIGEWASNIGELASKLNLWKYTWVDDKIDHIPQKHRSKGVFVTPTFVADTNLCASLHKYTKSIKHSSLINFYFSSLRECDGDIFFYLSGQKHNINRCITIVRQIQVITDRNITSLIPTPLKSSCTT